MAATLYAPELRLFLRRLANNPDACAPLGTYIEFNPPVNKEGIALNDPVSFVPMNAVEDGATGRFQPERRLLSEVVKGYTPFTEGDVLWAKITPCMQNGKSFIARNLTNNIGFGSTEFHVLRQRDERVSAEFIWEFLSLDSLRKAATYAFTGSAGHQRVPESFLAGLPFPKLQTNVQKSMVNQMDAARAERREKLKQADALLAGLDDFLLDALGLTPPPEDSRRVFAVRHDEVERKQIGPSLYMPALRKYLRTLNSSRFETRRLSDEVALNPTADVEGFDDSMTVSFIPMEAVAEGATGEVTPHYRALSEVMKGYTPFAEKDVLWAKITPCMENGKSCVALELENGIGFGSTEFHVLRPRSERVIPEYIFAFMSQTHLRRVARFSFTGSAGHQRVPADFLASLPFPVPPIAVQESIAAEFSCRHAEARRLRAEAEAGWHAARQWFEDQLLAPAP